MKGGGGVFEGVRGCSREPGPWIVEWYSINSDADLSVVRLGLGLELGLELVSVLGLGLGLSVVADIFSSSVQPDVCYIREIEMNQPSV